MKKTISLVLAVSILSFSCGKRLCCVLPHPEVMTAQRNGASWQAFLAKSILKNDTLTLASKGTISSADATQDSLYISFKYTQTGSYKLTGAEAVYVVGTNSATQRVTYLLDSTYNNTLDIDNYQVLYNQATSNPDPTQIKGTFNLKFTGPNNTSGVSLLDGKFTALLPN